MGQNIKKEPAYSMNPGVTVLQNGVIISAVFRGPEPCGLVLYNRTDGDEIIVNFTDEYRFGSLYCVKISGIDPADWCYRLFTGDNPMTGFPLLRTAPTGGEERPSFTACMCAALQCSIRILFPAREPFPPLPRRPSTLRILASMPWN